MKKIVIATDGSPSAQDAVDVGLEIAAEQGGDVTFVHVLPPDQFITGRNAPTLVVPHEVALDESETALREAAEAAEEAGVSFAIERVSGETVPEIVAIAEATEADLIVVGSRGRGPLTSALLGSVSRGVLDHAKTPVLIVRAANAPVASA
jgi:nucleotide-binding universal stress UspA family protein